MVNSVGFGSWVFATNTVSLGKRPLFLGSVSSLRRRPRSPCLEGPFKKGISGVSGKRDGRFAWERKAGYKYL